MVTGAAGFLGSHLVAGLLEQGKFDVIKAIDIVAPRFTDPRVENIKGDIANTELLAKIFSGAESVFHVASLIDLRNEAHRYARMRIINVVGAQNVVNACVTAGVSKLVYTSSAGVAYDGRPGFQTEKDYQDRPPKMMSSYGRTKGQVAFLSFFPLFCFVLLSLGCFPQLFRCTYF